MWLLPSLDLVVPRWETCGAWAEVVLGLGRDVISLVIVLLVVDIGVSFPGLVPRVRLGARVVRVVGRARRAGPSVVFPIG